MLSAFKDAAQLYPVSSDRPLTFLVSEDGGNKSASAFIALGLYPAGAVLKIQPTGRQLYAQPPLFSASVKESSASWGSTLPNGPFITPIANQQVVSTQVKVTIPAGGRAVYSGWSVEFSVILSGEVIDFLSVPAVVVQANQRVKSRIRLLPSSRKLLTSLPGFQFGTYRWRDETNTNKQVLVPTNWNIDFNEIGIEKFIAGIGDRSDLELKRLYRDDHSIHPIIEHGEYFTGHHRYFCPSKNGVLEIFRTTAGELTFPLVSKPQRLLPIFVGTYRKDDDGYYDDDLKYRYIAGNLNSLSGFDDSDPGYQFKYDPTGPSITLNQTPTSTVAFAGFVPDQLTAALDLPVFPMWSLTGAYVETPDTPAAILSFDQFNGVAKFQFSPNQTGKKLFIEYVPAVAVLYEAEADQSSPVSTDAFLPSDSEKLLGSVDLNPAFSGIASGYIYAIHRRQHARAITLYADKPRINIPATLSSIVGLVGFGPVYYENDYALLLAQVTGSTPQELIAGSRLVVVPSQDFQGFINYLDPTAQQVIGVSGGDGTCSFIYTPPKAYGFYLDPTVSTAGGNSILLPEPIALSQLWNANDGWTCFTYFVRDDQPFLGKVGSNVGYGEIAWVTNGAVGTIDYKTNGQRVIWQANNKPVVPVQAIDMHGVMAFNLDGTLNAHFNGNAVQLIYGAPLPTGSYVGAYYFSLSGRIQLQVMDQETGILSNTILLTLAPSPQITDTPDVNGYLYLSTSNSVEQGRLGANRLGGGPIPLSAFNVPRY